MKMKTLTTTLLACLLVTPAIYAEQASYPPVEIKAAAYVLYDGTFADAGDPDASIKTIDIVRDICDREKHDKDMLADDMTNCDVGFFNVANMHPGVEFVSENDQLSINYLCHSTNGYSYTKRAEFIYEGEPQQDELILFCDDEA